MQTLGEKLKELRLSKKLSIEDISNITRIRPQYLSAIEDNNFNVLPGVYVKSFIRTYANILKYDKEELENDLEEIFKVQHQSKLSTALENVETKNLTSFNPISKKKIKTTKSTNFLHYFLYAGLLISAVILLYFSFFGDNPTKSSDLNNLSTEKTSDTAIIKETANELLQFFQSSDSLIVEAKATDTAWLRVDIDGKKIDAGLMTPGMTKQWSALKYIIINLGNAGAIHFTRNGEELGYFGAKGTVIRNLKITRNKIESSAAPYDDIKSKKAKDQDTKIMQPLIEPSKIEPIKPVNAENN